MLHVCACVDYDSKSVQLLMLNRYRIAGIFRRVKFLWTNSKLYYINYLRVKFFAHCRHCNSLIHNATHVLKHLAGVIFTTRMTANAAKITPLPPVNNTHYMLVGLQVALGTGVYTGGWVEIRDITFPSSPQSYSCPQEFSQPSSNSSEQQHSTAVQQKNSNSAK